MGIGNRAGHGRPVRLLSYDIPVAAPKRYEFAVLDERMHMTHNFDVVAEGGEAKTESLKIAGREGIEWLGPAKATMLIHSPPSLGAGEVRHIDVVPGSDELVCIEPMHGENVVYYVQQANGKWQRQVLDPSLKQGHALGCADLLGDGRPQVVAGWRNPNGENKVGIKLYRPSPDGRDWTTLLVDDNHMACEDLKIADLDGDGLPEIVAAGRATNNLIVYWNIRSLGLPRERR